MVVLRNKINEPVLIDVTSNNNNKLDLQMSETVTRWDYISSFKPPPRLSIESGVIYCKEEIFAGDVEYDHVSSKFLSTFSGARNNAAMGLFNPQPAGNPSI